MLSGTIPSAVGSLAGLRYGQRVLSRFLRSVWRQNMRPRTSEKVCLIMGVQWVYALSSWVVCVFRGLYLDSNELNGTIPSAIGLLTDLWCVHAGSQSYGAVTAIDSLKVLFGWTRDDRAGTCAWITITWWDLFRRQLAC